MTSGENLNLNGCQINRDVAYRSKLTLNDCVLNYGTTF